MSERSSSGEYDVTYFDDEPDGESAAPKTAAITDPQLPPRFVHTKWHVMLTTYGWTKRGQNVPWSRRQPLFGNGLIDRGTPAYGQQVANWCNQYGIHSLSGYFEPTSQEDPMPGFRSSFWAVNLGNVKLCHMFGTDGFPNTRPRIESEVNRWVGEMQSAKWARMRIGTSATSPLRPILLFWGVGWQRNVAAFTEMIVNLRNLIAQRVGNPVIIATDHLVGSADHDQPAGSRNLFAQVDGAYTAACGLPNETTPVGGDHSGQEWDAVRSTEQLRIRSTYLRDVCRRLGKIYFSGTMPHFDRDLYVQVFNGDNNGANQGRVVATSFQQLQTQLTMARNFAPIVYSERRVEDDGVHIYREGWVILTSLNEWEEGSTLEPNLVRGTPYTRLNFDYGFDGFRAIQTVFRETVTVTGG